MFYPSDSEESSAAGSEYHVIFADQATVHNSSSLPVIVETTTVDKKKRKVESNTTGSDTEKDRKRKKTYYTGGNLNLDLLKIYKDIHGNVNVPNKFRVPANDARWPAELADFTLGRKVHKLRLEIARGRPKYAEEDMKALFDLGFVAEIKPVRKTTQHDILSAFETYKTKYLTVEIPKTFSIASDDLTWPPETRGIHIGEIFYRIQKDGRYPSVHQGLLNMGFDLKRKVERIRTSVDEICSLLRIYHSVHGHIKMSTRFRVPVGDINYPEKTWNYVLGRTLANIKLGRELTDHKELFDNLFEELAPIHE